MVAFRHTKDPFMIARDRTRVRSDAHGPCDGPGDFSRVTIRQGIDGRILAHERPMYESDGAASTIRVVASVEESRALDGRRRDATTRIDDASARDDDAIATRIRATGVAIARRGGATGGNSDGIRARRSNARARGERARGGR